MSDPPRQARDLELLDNVDGFKREPFIGEVWRVVRQGRDPVLGSPPRSRWCAGDFDVLYTSLEYNGAVAEVYALLSAQPVFPSRELWFAYKLKVRCAQTLNLADLATLDRLGVDTRRCTDRDYRRTQEIADVAHFLGFDGLLVPSARRSCANLVLFTDRIPPDAMMIVSKEDQPIDWDRWRKSAHR